jgi:hypothetical protein
MEAIVVETEPTEPVAETTEGSAPELGTTIAPELRVERRSIRSLEQAWT